MKRKRHYQRICIAYIDGTIKWFNLNYLKDILKFKIN